LQWLFDHAPVDRRWCLIHATHAISAEIHSIADGGAVAGLCPVTEANLGDGVFNAPDFVDRGGAFGVGLDSNVLIGLTDELRQLEYSQRDDAKADVFDYIERFYDPKRRHSTIGYLSPMKFERQAGLA
jgi:formimidoylglutamate deiminase